MLYSFSFSLFSNLIKFPLFSPLQLVLHLADLHFKLLWSKPFHQTKHYLYGFYLFQWNFTTKFSFFQLFYTSTLPPSALARSSALGLCAACTCAGSARTAPSRPSNGSLAAYRGRAAFQSKACGLYPKASSPCSSCSSINEWRRADSVAAALKRG